MKKFALASMTALAFFTTACGPSNPIAGMIAADPVVVTEVVTETTTSSEIESQAPAPAAPEPVVTPVAVPTATYDYSAYANTNNTSGPFAQSVLSSWLAAGRPVGTLFTAYSPVTGQNYSMTCHAWSIDEWGCYGGDNAGVTITRN